MVRCSDKRLLWIIRWGQYPLVMRGCRRRLFAVVKSFNSSGPVLCAPRCAFFFVKASRFRSNPFKLCFLSAHKLRRTRSYIHSSESYRYFNPETTHYTPIQGSLNTCIWYSTMNKQKKTKNFQILFFFSIPIQWAFKGTIVLTINWRTRVRNIQGILQASQVPICSLESNYLFHLIWGA